MTSNRNYVTIETNGTQLISALIIAGMLTLGFVIIMVAIITAIGVAHLTWGATGTTLTAVGVLTVLLGVVEYTNHAQV